MPRVKACLLQHSVPQAGGKAKSRADEARRGVISASSRQPTSTGQSMHCHSRYIRGAAAEEAGAAITEALPLPTPSPLPSASVDAAMATWQTLHTGLAPIIGQRGMAALFKRSLHLTRTPCPWLGPVCESAAGQDALDRLRNVLLRQTEAEISGAQCALLDNFRELLTTLIGASLTDRLMRSALDHTSSGLAAQDITP